MKGVVPAMVRGMVYGGLRLGLYTPIKEALQGSSRNDAGSTYKKIAAGITSGALAAAITNPMELVRVHGTPSMV
jgi:solute carrier family 25 (mitochondrial uncoupling protein), member 8/9